jgi:murein DD-endopeptidase MepM/ murein hydrolase activator NlpD
MPSRPYLFLFHAGRKGIRVIVRYCNVTDLKKGDSVSKKFFSIALAVSTLLFFSGCETLPTYEAEVPRRIEHSERLTTLRDTYPNGFYHTIEKGESLSAICKEYNVPLEKIAALNKLPDVSYLAIGQKLFIPGSNDSQTRTYEYEKIMSLPLEENFVRPLSGRVVSDFNAAINGGKNKGVDIEVPYGTEIRAAKSGLVVYSNNTVPNKGNMIIIEHRGDYQTLYANNLSHTVREGDIVAQGQVIAYVGKDRQSMKSFLHFEIRNKTIPENPRQHIPSL